MKFTHSTERVTFTDTRPSYSRLFRNNIVLLMLLVLSTLGCKKVIEESGNIGVCPIVTSTDPLDDATGIRLDKRIDAVFNEAMDPSTISTATFTLQNGTTSIAGTVTYTGMTATFTPSGNLEADTKYTATITTGAKDPAGNAIEVNYWWNFTTGSAADMVPPVITSTDPANAAVDVALDKKVIVEFSKSMNPATINGATFHLREGATPIAGAVSYAGTAATFTPSANLSPNTLYTVTVTTGSRDLAGNALAKDSVWTFTTAASMPTPPSVVLGRAARFGAFGGSAGITNEGLNTLINNGGIGTTGASTLVTGFHDGMTNDVYTETPLNVGNSTGGIFTAPPAPGTATSFTIASDGLNDATIAFNSISPASRPGGIDPGAGELGGLTLAPGVYKSASGTFNISNGNLTLDAMGDPNAEWIFQTASGLTVGIAGPTGARSVVMINGAQPKNVYWYVGSAATINGAGGGTMVGTIIASAGVTLSTSGNAVQTVLNGRALSLNASVTMVNTTINVPN